MILLLTLLFPGVLCLLLLAMERVEAPLRDESIGEHLSVVLDSARPEEVETVVSQSLAKALERYWRRHDLRTRLLNRRLARDS